MGQRSGYPGVNVGQVASQGSPEPTVRQESASAAPTVEATAMSTGTLETSEPMALPACLPAKPRRPLKEFGSTAIAVGRSYGLLVLLVLGSLPYLVASLIGGHLRRRTRERLGELEWELGDGPRPTPPKA